MSSAKRVLFLPSQSLYLFSFSCLIEVAGTDSMMLKSSADKGHHCLVPDHVSCRFFVDNFYQFEEIPL